MIQGNIVLALLIFAIGAFGVLWKTNAIAIFMCVEMMLNAANLAFVTFAQNLGKAEGTVFFLVVITIAAAEAAVGLALFIKIFNEQETIEVEDLNVLQG